MIQKNEVSLTCSKIRYLKPSPCTKHNDFVLLWFWNIKNRRRDLHVIVLLVDNVLWYLHTVCRYWGCKLATGITSKDSGRKGLSISCRSLRHNILISDYCSPVPGLGWCECRRPLAPASSPESGGLFCSAPEWALYPGSRPALTQPARFQWD